MMKYKEWTDKFASEVVVQKLFPSFRVHISEIGKMCSLEMNLWSKLKLEERSIQDCVYSSWRFRDKSDNFNYLLKILEENTDKIRSITDLVDAIWRFKSTENTELKQVF